MKVVICGGRHFEPAKKVYDELDRLHAKMTFTEMMEGGANGVDYFVRCWAKGHPEIKHQTVNADWRGEGNAAGPIRNARMISWKPDLVVAFPGGGKASRHPMTNQLASPKVNKGEGR